MWVIRLHLLLHTLQFVNVNSIAIKVTNVLPTEIEQCFLGDYHLTTLETCIGCVALCQWNPTCLLACQIGNKCRLYSANVSPNFNQSLSTALNLTGAACYSLWADTTDLAPKAVYYPKNEYSGGANEGFGCRKHLGYILAVGQTSTRGPVYTYADLLFPQTIKKVIIQTLEMPTTYFQNIEVRVGNVSGNGNFSQNQLLGNFSGPATSGQIVTFENNVPILGKYVSVQCMTKNGIAIIEMKIIPDI